MEEIRKNQSEYLGLNMVRDEENVRTVLLHSCCGPCSTTCIERLSKEYQVTVFFYNPNITDKEEYELRRNEEIRFINEFNKTLSPEYKVKFIEGEYIVSDYYEAIKGLEHEPEGGARCKECFRLRLSATARICKELGYDYFTTTLTVSPHKNSPLIFMLGFEEEKEFNVKFLDIDFKKKDGFKRSVELAKEYNLYRQNYCGCEFSKWFLD